MSLLADLVADLRFTLRMLRQNPGFSCVAILSLALGIGASSAMFSLVHALWVDPYPYRHANRIINLTYVNAEGRRGTMTYSLADYLELQKRTRTVEGIAARDMQDALVTSGLTESVRSVLFSPNAFEHFGVPALLGRTWTTKDIEQPAAPPRIAVLSHQFWIRHYNRNPDVIGKDIELDHQPHTILGVLPPRFTWNDADLYVPLPVSPDPRHSVPLMTHVRAGTNLDAVNRELQTITEEFARRSPNVYPKPGFRMQVQTLNDFLLARFDGTMKVLMAAVALLLVIGCANVSILLLARATARQREIAVRLSVGAGGRRLVRQLLTESVLVAVSGGLLGVLLAYRGVPALVAMMPQYSVPHEAVIHVNAPVVFFTFTVAVLTGILFGMAPALQLAKTDMNAAMQDGSRGSASSSRGGATRNILVVAEVALTIVLLVGAAVAIRSFMALKSQPLGYVPDRVLTMTVSVPQHRHTTWHARNDLFERLASQLRAVPGVQTATFTETAMPPYIGFRTEFEISGQPKSQPQHLRVGLIGSQYFETVGIQLLRGRLIEESEIARNAHFAVINQELEQRYFSSRGTGIGSRIHVPGLKLDNKDILMPPSGDQWFEVVGVVASARNRGLQEQPEPAIYVPYKMATVPGATFLLKTSVDPNSIVRSVREHVRKVDPDLPVAEVRTLEDQLNEFERAYPRFSTTLFSLFAAIGLLLAGSGLYSVVAYTVARRTPEFGIRIALGARRAHILRMVLVSVGLLMAVGSTIGLLSSWALSSVIARYIEGWNPRDPIAYVAVLGALVLTALAACLIPARRASGIQPMIALKHK